MHRGDKHAHKPSTQTYAGPCWATQTEKWEKATNKKSHQQWYQPWGPTHTLLSENSEQYQSFAKTSCTALAIRRQQTKRIKSRGERLQRIAGDVCEGPICNLLSTLFYKLYTAAAASVNSQELRASDLGGTLQITHCTFTHLLIAHLYIALLHIFVHCTFSNTFADFHTACYLLHACALEHFVCWVFHWMCSFNPWKVSGAAAKECYLSALLLLLLLLLGGLLQLLFMCCCKFAIVSRETVLLLQAST